MNAIRALRLAAGFTQDELSERSGVAQPNIAAYERGQRKPSPAMLGRLRAAAAPRPSIVLREHRGDILRLAAEHRASQVRVFGSVARGEDVSGSDLDLLVRFDDDADVFDLADLVASLEELTGIQVDVVSEGGLRAGSTSIDQESVAL